EANRGGRRSGERGCYLFSGVATCAHCGRSLVGKVCRGKTFYSCSRLDDLGRVVCDYNAIAEADLRRRVMAALQEDLLGADSLKKLRRQARERDEREQSPQARDALAARLAELGGMINQGNANLALIPADLIPGVVGQIRAWEEEGKRLR